MNTEKLDALASQAGFDVKRLRAPHPGGFPREDMLALESFAELLIQECMKVTVNYPHPQTKLTAAEHIARHFGVE